MTAMQKRTLGTFPCKKKILYFIPILFLLLTACMKVGPDYVRPNVAIEQNWQEAQNARLKSGPSDYKNWWSVFKDPVLNELIERSYRDNLTLRIAGVRVLQSRARLGIIVGDFYPQTQNANGALQYNRSSSSASFSGGVSYTQSDIGIAAGWELDFWGRFRRAIESADAAWLSSIANYDNTLVTLTADVASTYILIRTLEKRIAIARENAMAQEEIMRIVNTRFQHGTVSQLDVEQATTALKNTLALVPSLEAQLRQAMDALCILLGLPPGSLNYLLAEPSAIPVSPPEVVVGIPVDLLRRRPDIRNIENLAAAQCAQIGVAKADYYPAFSLNGIFGFLSTDVKPSSLSDLFKWSSRYYQTGPVFQWNLFNYGRISNNVRLQDAFFQEMLITYQNAVLTAQRDVEDNLIAFLMAQERADLLASSAAAARKALDIAYLQYKEGTKDFTTVMLAQQTLLTEQDNLASTLGNQATNLVGVYRSLGGGWEWREGRDILPPDMKKDMARRTDWGQLLAPSSYNPPSDQKPDGRVRLPDW
jgi:NodT family efflux transporter outer membrane factor (OMF) lipoprotein